MCLSSFIYGQFANLIKEHHILFTVYNLHLVNDTCKKYILSFLQQSQIYRKNNIHNIHSEGNGYLDYCSRLNIDNNNIVLAHKNHIISLSQQQLFNVRSIYSRLCTTKCDTANHWLTFLFSGCFSSCQLLVLSCINPGFDGCTQPGALPATVDQWGVVAVLFCILSSSVKRALSGTTGALHVSLCHILPK